MPAERTPERSSVDEIKQEIARLPTAEELNVPPEQLRKVLRDLDIIADLVRGDLPSPSETERAEQRKRDILSAADLIKSGASVDAEGNVSLSDEQISETIKRVQEESASARKRSAHALIVEEANERLLLPEEVKKRMELFEGVELLHEKYRQEFVEDIARYTSPDGRAYLDRVTGDLPAEEDRTHLIADGDGDALREMIEARRDPVRFAQIESIKAIIHAAEFKIDQEKHATTAWHNEHHPSRPYPDEVYKKLQELTKERDAIWETLLRAGLPSMISRKPGEFVFFVPSETVSSTNVESYIMRSEPQPFLHPPYSASHARSEIIWHDDRSGLAALVRYVLAKAMQHGYTDDDGNVIGVCAADTYQANGLRDGYALRAVNDELQFVNLQSVQLRQYWRTESPDRLDKKTRQELSDHPLDQDDSELMMRVTNDFESWRCALLAAAQLEQKDSHGYEVDFVRKKK